MDYLALSRNTWFTGVIPIASNAALLVYALVKKPTLFRYLAFFSAITLFDALFASGYFAGRAPETHAIFEFVFLLLADLRFILLLAFLVYAGKTLTDVSRFRLTGDVLRPAVIFTFFATLLVSALQFAKPQLMQTPLHKTFAYEVVFAALVFLWNFVVLPQKPVGDTERAFMRSIAVPVLGYYSLAALGDYLLLQNMQVGYAAKAVGRLISSSLFLWWVAMVARARTGAY